MSDEPGRTITYLLLNTFPAYLPVCDRCPFNLHQLMVFTTLSNFPLFKTIISSAFLTVLKRCAITSEVRFCIILLMASCTSLSLSVSSDDVASSSISIGGFLIQRGQSSNAVFHHRLALRPCLPMFVLNFSGLPSINRKALATLAAFSISSWGHRDAPK